MIAPPSRLVAAAGLLLSACSDGGTAVDPAPTVAITAPAPGPVSGRVLISAAADASSGVAGVLFTIDGEPLGGEDATSPWTAPWDSWLVDDGPHTLAAVVRDSAGRLATSAPVTVTVANVAATGAIRLLVATGGPHIDVDGYVVSAGGVSLAVPTRGTVLVPAVPVGTHSVHATGVARNCVAAPLEVTVPAGSATEATLVITCTAVFTEGFAFPVYGSTTFGQIAIAPANGAPVTGLSTGVFNDGDPAWSPDGQRIAFTTDRGGQQGIYVMSADGTGVGPLVQRALPSAAGRWSPDGEAIAFEGGGLWIQVLDGSEPRVLTAQPAGSVDRAPVWSPDGSRIAFARHTTSPGGSSASLVVADVATGASDTLRVAQAGEFITPADWSADGRILVTVSGGAWGADGDIAVIAAAGGAVQLLTDDGAADLAGTWTNDGSGALFSTGRFGADFAGAYISADGVLLLRLTTPQAGRNHGAPAARP